MKKKFKTTTSIFLSPVDVGIEGPRVLVEPTAKP
jgi:hypothetical protein